MLRAAMATLTLSDRPSHPIAPAIFGQFLERVGWCPEVGPEAAMDAGGWRPAVVDALRAARVPLWRYPGGNDVDRTDWRFLVDGASGPGPRPPVMVTPNTTVQHERTTRAGYDEILRLGERLDVAPIIVLNLGDALAKRKPLEEAVANAAGLVAYLTAPVGARLPAGMPDWPQLRAANGHPAPYRIPWIQLGNETWWPHKHAKVQEALGGADRAGYLAWYRTCILALISAVRAVHPTVPLIMDGLGGLGIEEEILRDPAIRPEIAAVCLHSYSPWVFSELRLGTVPWGGATLAADAISHDDWWRLLTSCPGYLDAAGQNIGWSPEEMRLYEQLDLPLAITEWNWNGFDDGKGAPSLDLVHASMVGTANFLHGLVRRGDRVVLACQSMLMGNHWDITGLRLDPAGAAAPFRVPQFAMTCWYRQHLGSHLLPGRLSGVGGAPQPYATGNQMARAHAHVADLDVLATANGPRSIVSVVNRTRDQALPLTIAGGARHPGAVRLRVETAGCLDAAARPHRLDAVRITAAPERVVDAPVTLTIPPASVVIATLDPL
jgi:alpha-L-arabinofuranosidase